MGTSVYAAFGIRSTESTLCTAHVGSASQLVDACLATDDELQRCMTAGKRGLRLDRLGNEVCGDRAHRLIERRGEHRFEVTVFHDADEFDRRCHFAGALSKARADRSLQAVLQRLAV